MRERDCSRRGQTFVFRSRRGQTFAFSFGPDSMFLHVVERSSIPRRFSVAFLYK